MESNILKYQQPLIKNIGLCSILLFAISIFSDRDLNRIAEALMIISILFSLKSIYTYERENSGLWIYLLIIISFFTMYIANNVADVIYPTLNLNHDQFSRRYLRILFFVFVGWWVIKQQKTIWLLLGCFSLAFTIRVIASGDFLRISSLYDFSRFAFGFSNAQHSAAFSGSLLITYISLSPAILKIKNNYTKTLTGMVVVALLLIAFIVTLASQTRAVWLAIFIVAGIAALPWAILFVGKSSPHLKFKLSIYYIALLIIFLTVASLSQSISKRVMHTVTHALYLSQLQVKDIPLTSAGIRIHQWNLALDLIKEKPFSGHGGATKKYLIKISNMPKRAISNFGHFHNSYLELGVAYGLCATFIFIFILGFLLYRIIKTYNDKQISPEFAFWGISWIVFFTIINIFESYVMYRTGYFLFIIFGGIIYGITSKPYIKIINQQEKSHAAL
ncbi:MAG: O-antigen ligase [Marinobacter maritimus]